MGCSRPPARWLVLAAALWLLGAAPAGAAEAGGPRAWDLGGSLRILGTLADTHRLGSLAGGRDSAVQGQGALRLTAAGRTGHRWAYEAHLVGSYLYSSPAEQGTAGWGTAGGATRYRALDATWHWRDQPGQEGLLWWDRLNVKLSLGQVDITLGRQAITFGKAYFFNPLDVFLPFDPRQFDREYKAGVDGLRVDVYLGDFSGLTLVAVAGRELDWQNRPVDGEATLAADWYGSALLVRGYTTLAGWDLAVQGGKVYGGWQLGGALTGELGPLSVRAEAAYLWADGRRPLPPPLSGDIIQDHLTLVLGLGHRWANSLTLEAEYLFNGAGDPDHLEAAMARVNAGAALQMGRHLLGATLSYEITPLVLGRLVMLYSLSDHSCLWQPILTISVADDVEMLAGASLGLGAAPDSAARVHSEFGSYPTYFFVEFKFYF